MTAGRLGGFVGACFLWKGIPKSRTLATCCCLIPVISLLISYGVSRLVNSSNSGVLAYVASTILQSLFSVTRLLLLKTRTSETTLRALANWAIAAIICMSLLSIAFLIWQVGLNKSVDFTSVWGKALHGSLLLAYVVTALLEIRFVYLVLRDELLASVPKTSFSADQPPE